MNESIYAPPDADISVVPESDSDYYVVGSTKFVLLMVITGNLYSLYWYYRQWRSIKRRDGSDVWPLLRTIFAIFFTHSLFADIRATLGHRGIAYRWSPMLFASLAVLYYVFSTSMIFLPDEIALKPAVAIVSLALTPLLAFLLLPAQKAANAAAGDAAGTANRALTGANWVWLIIGGFLWLLQLFNLFIVLTRPELLLPS